MTYWIGNRQADAAQREYDQAERDQKTEKSPGEEHPSLKTFNAIFGGEESVFQLQDDDKEQRNKKYHHRDPGQIVYRVGVFASDESDQGQKEHARSIPPASR